MVLPYPPRQYKGAPFRVDVCGVLLYGGMRVGDPDPSGRVSGCPASSGPALNVVFSRRVGEDMLLKNMREKVGVSTLRAWREEPYDKFTAKCLKNERFMGWFPERPMGRATRGSEHYLETFVRCEKLRNSPLFYDT